MLKILYLSPIGKKIDLFFDPDGTQPYDMDTISDRVIKGIKEKTKEVEITLLTNFLKDDKTIPVEDVSEFDLYICDLTTSNPNVTHYAGVAEGMGKPVIYICSNDSSIPTTMMGVDKKLLRYSLASLDNEFKHALGKLINLVSDDLKSFMSKSIKQPKMPKAFISYSHKDKAYLDRLMVHLKPLVKKGVIDVWVDTKIKAGEQWQKEIEKALDNSNISILLISADFMASDFIVDNELPPLLSKAEVNGTRILPVIVSPCRFSREPSLSRFQTINLPDNPLSSMDEDRREVNYDKLAADIEKSLAEFSST